MIRSRWNVWVLCSLLSVSCAGAPQPKEPVAPAAPAASTTIVATRLLVRDLPSAQAFYEKSFGLAQVQRREQPGEPVEVTLGYSSGARLVLVEPAAELEPTLAKTQFPVVLLRTPELDAVVKRIETAGTAVRRLPATPALRVAITRDPSGNTVEILDGGAGSPPVVGGSKLIVDDRKQAEEFYTSVFGVSPGQRYSSSAFDEVLLGFGSGPFLALFQPLQEKPLQKSQYVVTQFSTADFVAVVERLRAQGGFLKVVASRSDGSRRALGRDPSGNVIEILSR